MAAVVSCVTIVRLINFLFLTQVLWLLTYDDDKSTLTEAVDKYSVGVPPIQWLPWIPQLLTCLVRNEGTLILNLLSQVRPVEKLLQFQIESTSTCKLFVHLIEHTTQIWKVS